MTKPLRAHIYIKFWKKFLRLTRGRVNVLRALKVICLEEKDPAFKDAVASIHADLDKGIPLSDAISKFPAEFSPSIIELVKTAEKTGAWDEILQEIADGLADGTFD
jgi:type IV pilus assembly protein PilC